MAQQIVRTVTVRDKWRCFFSAIWHHWDAIFPSIDAAGLLVANPGKRCSARFTECPGNAGG